MKKLLQQFDKETLVEYISGNLWLRDKQEMEIELLRIQWEKQSLFAEKILSGAMERLNAAKTRKASLQAQLDYEKGMAAYKKADRLWAKLESKRAV